MARRSASKSAGWPGPSLCEMQRRPSAIGCLRQRNEVAPVSISRSGWRCSCIWSERSHQRDGEHMNPSQPQSDDLIPNPPNRVMGAIPDVAKAREAIKELLRQGVEAEDIDLLHGDEGMHRLDPADAELGSCRDSTAPWSNLPPSTRSHSTCDIISTTFRLAVSCSWCAPLVPDRSRRLPTRLGPTAANMSGSSVDGRGKRWTTRRRRPCCKGSRVS